jgi:hypothetical protein
LIRWNSSANCNLPGLQKLWFKCCFQQRTQKGSGADSQLRVQIKKRKE